MHTHRRAIVYVRVSTYLQVDNYSSLDQRGLTTLAERYGFTDVQIREEPGVSAETLTGRPVMQAILEEVANNEVGALVVSSFSRLSRDMDDIDGRLIKKICRDHQCVIITPERVYDFRYEADSDLADLEFFFSKIQKRLTMKSLVRGLYLRMESGGFLGRPLSLGYDYSRQLEMTRRGPRLASNLVINEPEAAVVRYIFERGGTMSFQAMARHLNELAAQGGIMYFPLKWPSMREKYGSHRPWRASDVRSILRNRIYTGQLRYAVQVKSPHLRGVEPIVLERPDLRIISDEQFERNQQFARIHRKASRRTPWSSYLFGRVLRCPVCNGGMNGRSYAAQAEGGSVRYYGYECAAYAESGPSVCRGYWLNEADVLHGVLPFLTTLVRSSLTASLASVTSPGAAPGATEATIDVELKVVQRAIQHLLRAVREGVLDLEPVGKENARLLDQQRNLERRRGELQHRRELERRAQALLDQSDSELQTLLLQLTANRLSFNTLLRLFFGSLTVQTDCNKYKSRRRWHTRESAPQNPRLTRYTLATRFAVAASGEAALAWTGAPSSNDFGNAWEFLEAVSGLLRPTEDDGTRPKGGITKGGDIGNTP